MKLAGRAANLVLSDDGRRVLELLSIFTGRNDSAPVEVVEAEDLGLWLSVLREDGEHHVLLRWEYIIAVDVVAEEETVVGLSIERK